KADPREMASFHFGESGPECLLLHGFTGSPWDLKPLAGSLAVTGFQGNVPLFPGHGTSSMEGIRAEDWLDAGERALSQAALKAKGPVRVAGFSMGALVAVVVASRRLQDVAALALLAPAARLQDPAAAIMKLVWNFPGAMALTHRFIPLQKRGPPDMEDPIAR